MQTIILPARLDAEAARQLATDIQQALLVGGVHLDGGAVEKIGLSGLQLLACAVRHEAAHAPVIIVRPSDALRQAADIGGLSALLFAPSEQSA